MEALAERDDCKGLKWIGVATGPWMEFVRLIISSFLSLLSFLLFCLTHKPVLDFLHQNSTYNPKEIQALFLI